MITRVATTGDGALFAVRHEDGVLYHHRMKGSATIAEPIPAQDEQQFLDGAEKNGWDMTPVDFVDWDSLHAARKAKAQENRDRHEKYAKNWEQGQDSGNDLS
jgi:hypothetical protein